MRQDEAFDLLKMGKNIFLTGAAGSGKTYLLNKYIHYLKEHNVKVAITASTGIAATHLQGITIHSWLGIGIKDYLTQTELEKLQTSKRIKRNLKNTKVLIIDEISMLHKNKLDMVDTITRYLLNSESPFGGIQVILCGDFFQLPPISSNEEKKFAFESVAWQKGEFHICYLHEQHRQGNDALLTILNDIRNGVAGEHTKIPLRTRYKKEPEANIKPTKLYSRNINVDAINENELSKINGQEKIFTMSTRGPNILVDGLKSSCLALEKLRLKIGAEVMFIKNDILGNYFNGTRCVVIGFEKNESSLPIVKTYDHKTMVVYPEEWEYEENGIVRATISQLPLRLAWAITIHKSQGMTLDAAEIDLGDAFEPGMGYVALSRVRSLNGLKLMNLNEMALKVHAKVLQHDNVFKENSETWVNYLQTLSETEKKEYQEQTLVNRFGGSFTKANKENKKIKSTSVATHLLTFEMLNEKLSIEAIAIKRELSIRTIFTHLEKLKGLQLINDSHIAYLKEGLSQTEFDTIWVELTMSEDRKLKPIYEKFEGKYSYQSIQLVRLFVE